MWVRSPLEEMKYLFTFIFSFIYSFWCRGESAALSSATQHVMPPEIGGKWGTEYLNNSSPLPTLLCAGHSVKLNNNLTIRHCILSFLHPQHLQLHCTTMALCIYVNVNNKNKLKVLYFVCKLDIICNLTYSEEET